MAVAPRVAIIGMGAIGSMTAWRLAARGVAVTGFDQYAPASNRGASAGETRMYRVAYKEGPEYAELLQSAAPLWKELQQRSGRTLFQQHGSLTIGNPDHEDLQSIRENADAYDLELLELGHDAMAERFSQWRLYDGEIGIYDPLGGLLRPEAAVISAIEQAQHAGMELRTGVRVSAVEESASEATVTTDHGTETFDRVIVAPGPWADELLGGVIPRVRPERIVSIWFPTDQPREFGPDRFVPTLRRGDGLDLTAFPSVDGNFVKVNLHLPRTLLDAADGWDRTIEDEYVEATREAVRRGFNGLHDIAVRREAYHEGYTADDHPVVGPVSTDGRVIAATGFSGHGFKFASSMGEAIAQLVTTGETDFAIDHMSPTRAFVAYQ
ncbi:MAG: N-methyl-L-tryptophan oxidase [Gulosibacter sp.]|uniref:N-methyl-L-tryptophan oxidase n=1 Tax=Gulosibacter sp. TaxID=2817531 RepID=UPI003F8FF232